MHFHLYGLASSVIVNWNFNVLGLHNWLNSVPSSLVMFEVFHYGSSAVWMMA